MPRIIPQDSKASLSLTASASQYGVAAVSQITGFTKFTVSFWFNLRSSAGSHRGAAFMGYNTTRVAFIPRRQAGNFNIGYWDAFNGWVESKQQATFGTWIHVAYVINSGTNLKIFINGVLDTTAPLTNLIPATLDTLGIGGSDSLGEYWDGSLSDFKIFTTNLNDGDAKKLYTGELISTQPVVYYKLNEGVGSSLYDSINGNTITLSNGGSYTKSTPTKKRGLINDNLVYNGNFEFAPPSSSNIPTTTSLRGINGTASGSNAIAFAPRLMFGWESYLSGVNSSVFFDSSNAISGQYSMCCSVPTAGGIASAATHRTAAGFAEAKISVTPSASYSVSGTAKAVLYSGSSNTGARVRLLFTDAANVVVSQSIIFTSNNTIPATAFSGIAVAPSTARYVVVLVEVIGDDGAQTLVMDAWFDDIVLKPVQPITRAMFRNMNASLIFNGGSTIVSVPHVSGLPIYNTTGYSIAAWVRVTSFSSNRVIFAEGNTSNNAPLFSLDVAQAGDDRIGVFLRNSVGTVLINNVKALARIPFGQWVHVVWVDIGGNCSMYINGIRDNANFNYVPIGIYGFNSSTFGAQVRTTTTNFFAGNMRECQIFNHGLTQDQVQSVMNGGLRGNVVSYQLGEGAGSTAYDISGNNNHATITSGVYSSNVPIKARQPIDRNLVYNGDFEYAPPFVAAQISTGGYIDGTAGGSSTNMLFGWALSFAAGSVGVSFDTTVAKSGRTSIKLSTLNGSGNLVVGQSLLASGPTALEARTLLAAVLPNTSYTLTAWVKTNNVVTNSAFVDIREFTGGLVSSTTTASNKLSGTNDWTQVAVTVVTASTTRYIGVLLRNAIPGNVSDAWFDDIELRPTTPTTRQLIT